jgi:L-fuculose-phosphate aldolase
MQSTAERIVAAGKLMFELRLTDIAGGNISCRYEDQILITPTGAGQKYLWDLSPVQILNAPISTDDLLDNPQHSKESISHLYVYRAYPQVNAIIHAHPFHVMPFCAAEMPLPAVIKSAQVYGSQFEQIAEKPMYSREQAEEIVARMAGKEEKLSKFAAGLLMPKHGVFVAAGTLNKALDCLERMATNAYCVISQKTLGN